MNTSLQPDKQTVSDENVEFQKLMENFNKLESYKVTTVHLSIVINVYKKEIKDKDDDQTNILKQISLIINDMIKNCEQAEDHSEENDIVKNREQAE